MVQDSTSLQLIHHSPDLKRLYKEGYEIEIRENYLLLKNVPYVCLDAEIKYGVMIAALAYNDNVAVQPPDHTVWWAGFMPCDRDGNSLAHILQVGRNSVTGPRARQELGDGVLGDYNFSKKPVDGAYADYYEKMTTYEQLISRHALELDPNVTAQTFAPALASQDSPFVYSDSATARAQIGPVVDKLKLSSVAIVGLGGTGSYILDFVAKTPVKEIHLFDGDRFGQHNAFRAPGAPPAETFEQPPRKSDYYKDIYSTMHRGISSHSYIDEANVEFLKDMDFVFLASGSGELTQLAERRLLEFEVPFVRVGMGLYKTEDEFVGGMLRIAFNKPSRELPTPNDDEGIYTSAIQIADLNALNAVLAVIRWKKYLEFYVDAEPRAAMLYQISGNSLSNNDGDRT